jgi:chloride channel protein, CIC family
MLKHNVGRLPVVERSNHRKVVGYLGRASIMNARQRNHADEEDRARGFATKRGAGSEALAR